MENDFKAPLKENSFLLVDSKLFMVVIFGLSYLLCKVIIMSSINKYAPIIQTGSGFLSVVLFMTAFIIYWITHKVYETTNGNTYFFGFLVSTLFNLMAIFSIAPLKLNNQWNVETSVKFFVFGRLAEIAVIIVGSTGIIKQINSKKISLILTVTITAALSKLILIMPWIFTYKLKTTSLYSFFNIIIFILYISIIIYRYNITLINRTAIREYLMPGLIFGATSSLCFLLASQHISGFLLWGSIQRYIFYCYLFRSFLKIYIVYPYRKIQRLYSETEERYKSSFDNLSIGVALTDLDGHIIKANKPLLQILGYDEKELMGLMFENIIPDGDTYINEKSIESLLGNSLGKVLMFEVRYIHKNGQRVWVKVNISRANNFKGEPQYFVYELQDITSNRKVVELELGMQQKKKQLLETLELDKIRTEFIANLSHELRTPLNVITGATQLLELNLADNMNEKTNTNLKYIRQNSRRLLRLVNNLIDTTKLEAGFQNLNLSNFDIINLVEDITLSIVDYTSLNGLELLFDTNIEEKVIACDPDKIERIILNLLSNAIKFTNKGGSIFVCIEDKGENITISIKDTGIGIPLDKQDIIFDRFRQVEKSLTKTREGSGIGLSLVKALVEQHGGKITVISELGNGSEFIITLPVYVVDNDTTDNSGSLVYLDRVERIKVEFSDIYLKNDEEPAI